MLCETPRVLYCRNPMSPIYLLWDSSCILIIYCGAHPPELINYRPISNLVNRMNQHESKENIHFRSISISLDFTCRVRVFQISLYRPVFCQKTRKLLKWAFIILPHHVLRARVVVKWWKVTGITKWTWQKDPAWGQCRLVRTAQAQWVWQPDFPDRDVWNENWFAQFFLGTAPVTCLLAKHRPVPRRLKNTVPVRKIEIGLKWMFSLNLCGFIRA